jgi:hypothetical protein
VAGGFVHLPWLRLAQVDADPQKEIVVGGTNGQIYVLDAVELSTRSLGPQDVRALETIDRDGDGVSELLVGTAAGHVRQIDAITGAVVELLFTEAASVDALVAGDLDGDLQPDLVTASGNAVRVRSGTTGLLLWNSGVLAHTSSSVGRWDSVLLADADGHEGLEILVNLGRAGFTVFSARP